MSTRTFEFYDADADKLTGFIDLVWAESVKADVHMREQAQATRAPRERKHREHYRRPAQARTR